MYIIKQDTFIYIHTYTFQTKKSLIHRCITFSILRLTFDPEVCTDGSQTVKSHAHCTVCRYFRSWKSYNGRRPAFTWSDSLFSPTDHVDWIPIESDRVDFSVNVRSANCRPRLSVCQIESCANNWTRICCDLWPVLHRNEVLSRDRHGEYRKNRYACRVYVLYVCTYIYIYIRVVGRFSNIVTILGCNQSKLSYSHRDVCRV